MGRREEQQKRVGRRILAVIYLIYCGLYAYALHTSPATVYQEVLGVVILTMIWTTALLGALCFNQRWARYVFLGLIVVSVSLFIPFVWDLLSRHIRPPNVVWVLVGFHAIVFTTLSYSPFVKALGKK